jgi:hypothetical protein
MRPLRDEERSANGFPYSEPKILFIHILGRDIPDWPKLLHLYSRLKPGKPIFEWMKDYEVEELGIDVRRFTSFGVIKVGPLSRFRTVN